MSNRTSSLFRTSFRVGAGTRSTYRIELRTDRHRVSAYRLQTARYRALRNSSLESATLLVCTELQELRVVLSGFKFPRERME